MAGRLESQIASVEAESATAKGGAQPNLGLFAQEHRGLVSLRRQLAHLQGNRFATCDDPGNDVVIEPIVGDPVPGLFVVVVLYKRG